MEDRGQRMQEDYRLDYGVAEACEADVTTHCSAEKVSTLTLLKLQSAKTSPGSARKRSDSRLRLFDRSQKPPVEMLLPCCNAV